MNDLRRPPPYAIAAAACVVLGLAVSAWVVRGTPDQLDRIRARSERIERLDELAGAQRAPAAVLAALSARGATEPGDPRALLAAAVPGMEFTLTEVEPVTLQDGWVARAANVEMEEASLPDIGRAVTALEGGSPPWRVTECRIVPAAEGRGRATLRIESLARSGPS